MKDDLRARRDVQGPDLSLPSVGGNAASSECEQTEGQVHFGNVGPAHFSIFLPIRLQRTEMLLRPLRPQLLFVVLLTLLISCIGTALAQRPDLPRVEDRRYEDLSTFKNKRPYIVDPYTWVYTKEFAELYRMPDRWIDEGLKGAYAVAFRMSTVGNLSCGLAGREDNCWPPLYCQIDLYYDNRIKLPWVREDVVRDFLISGVSSRSHLVPSNPKIERRYIPKDPEAPSGVMEGMSLELSIPNKMSGGIWDILYYDKQFQPTIGLIGFRGLCPMLASKAYLHFYDKETTENKKHRRIRSEDAKPMHTVELPESFMQRAHEAYVRDNQPNRDTAEKLLKPFYKDRDAKK